MKTPLRFRIQSELKRTDYRRLRESLRKDSQISIELFPGANFEFVSVSAIVIAAEKFGYKIKTEISFKQPIGFEVYDHLELDDDVHTNLAVNRRGLRLSRIVIEPSDLDRDLNKLLKTTTRIVNHVCSRHDQLIKRTFMLDSGWIDKQLEKVADQQELAKRAETPKPFGTIHAQSSKEAKKRASNLIPLYKEYDKTYLYAAKRVYFLLPHDFVANLLRCDAVTMVREEEFDKRGMPVLRDLVYKKRLRKHEMPDGITCYYDLDEKTQRYLKKHLEHRNP